MYTCYNMLLFSIRNGPHNTRVLFFTSSLHLNVCNCQACQRFPFLYSSSYKKRQTTLRPTTHVPNCITTSNSRPFNIYLVPLSLISRWHWWDKFFICVLSLLFSLPFWKEQCYVNTASKKKDIIFQQLTYTGNSCERFFTNSSLKRVFYIQERQRKRNPPDVFLSFKILVSSSEFTTRAV